MGNTFVKDDSRPVRVTPPSVVGLKVFKEIAPGHFNVRGKLPMMGGLIDIGTHMSLLRLKSGNFIAIDAVDPISATGLPKGSVKDDIDRITANGSKLEAVIATHPYHTLYFPAFYKCYSQAKYYGTPRHLGKQKAIPWAGSVTDEKVRKLFEPEVAMGLPPTASSEFVHAKVHFNNLFVLHRPSKSLFNDDCIGFFDSPASTMGKVVWLSGFRHNQMVFHSSMFKGGLRANAKSAPLFISWLKDMVKSEDIQTVATAHNGVCYTNGKQRILQLIAETQPKVLAFQKKYAAEGAPVVCTKPSPNPTGWSDDPTETECG